MIYDKHIPNTKQLLHTNLFTYYIYAYLHNMYAKENKRL